MDFLYSLLLFLPGMVPLLCFVSLQKSKQNRFHFFVIFSLLGEFNLLIFKKRSIEIILEF